MERVLRMIMLWLFGTSVVLLSSSPATAQGSAQAAIFGAEELDQLVAPVALYPDALLAQILMASTYPLEVVSAEGGQIYDRSRRPKGGLPRGQTLRK